MMVSKVVGSLDVRLMVNRREREVCLLPFDRKGEGEG